MFLKGFYYRSVIVILVENTLIKLQKRVQITQSLMKIFKYISTIFNKFINYIPSFTL